MKGRGGGGGVGGWRKRREEDEEEEELFTSGGDGGGGEEVMEGGRVEEEDDEEEEEEEMMEDEDGDEERRGGGEGGVKVVEEKPKLDEGFYEIEDVRRKRVRKGEIQYLIKWRGWPETSNTWEPIENLQACCDVIEAFEESLRSGKHRLSRRRKRKYGVTNTQPRKKQRCTTSNLSAFKVGLHSDGHFSSASLDNSSLSAPLPSVGGGFEVSNVIKRRDHGDSEAKNNGDANNSESTAQKTETENGSSTYNSQQDELNNGGTEREQNLNELKVTTSTGNLNSEKFLVHCSDTRTSDKDGLRDGFPKAECAEPVQNNRFIGAKRRKSGSVRRFKQDPASLEVDEPHSTIQRNTTKFSDKFETRGVEDGNSKGNGAGDKNMLDGLINPASITKIIKPISYSASISSSVQDVCVTFMAMRSDGSEVVVDNKFLKANNPLLLISFYEQHLRYSPPA